MYKIRYPSTSFCCGLAKFRVLNFYLVSFELEGPLTDSIFKPSSPRSATSRAYIICLLLEHQISKGKVSEQLIVPRQKGLFLLFTTKNVLIPRIRAAASNRMCEATAVSVRFGCDLLCNIAAISMKCGDSEWPFSKRATRFIVIPTHYAPINVKPQKGEVGKRQGI